jgi:tryptophanyl-tRNA synthetase
MSKKIFSGVQPTGNLHLGNYLGAIKNFVDLNNDTENDCIFCVVDLHAITVKQDSKELKNNIRETVATFIASGIDPRKSIIFNQSGVAAHSEGAWILSCVARMGWLNRMTQFKEKAGKDKEKASVGLYSYPVLMAADILLYDATHVPVGDDQKQHLELCRDIAQKFNNDFDQENFLQVPEPLIQKEFSRIMSLKDGSKKMSKSELSDLSRINLTDDKDTIVNKIKKAKTDPLPMPSNIEELNERLEARNLLGIYSSLNNSSLQNTVENFSGKNFSEFKDQLSDLLVKKIEPISLEIKKLLDDQSYLDKILLEGVEKANSIASKKIDRIKEILGFNIKFKFLK